jgi:hypothetical protein
MVYLPIFTRIHSIDNFADEDDFDSASIPDDNFETDSQDEDIDDDDDIEDSEEVCTECEVVVVSSCSLNIFPHP